MIRRTIRYGLLYWLSGAAITLGLARMAVPRGTMIAVFYILAVIIPIVFFSLFFRRSEALPTRSTALRVGAIWIAVITAFDLLFYVWFFGISTGTYFSWFLFQDYVFILVGGVFTAALFARRKSIENPEGLA
ncbi:MAG: hypothetical protein Q8P82_01485 [bacterium]|nr:hypothetical protein [bacterium]